MAAVTAAAERGFAVFPCKPGGKTPAVPDHKEADCDGADWWCRNGHQGWEPRATTDRGRITRAWLAEPRNNFGVACGPSRLIVIDLDAHGGELPEEWRLPGINDGRDVFAQICEWAGTEWPSTYTVFTPSGGMHLYFRTTEEGFRNKAGNTLLGPMIDIRAQGGYVVGAGSVTSGGEYVLTDDRDPQPIPALVELIAGMPARPEKPHRRDLAAPPDAASRLAGLIRAVEAAQAGNRTGALVWAAFTLRDMIAAGEAAEADGELLVQAAVAAGINGGDRYARNQVRSVLGRKA
jgi:hypothetical protein